MQPEGEAFLHMGTSQLVFATTGKIYRPEFPNPTCRTNIVRNSGTWFFRFDQFSVARRRSCSVGTLRWRPPADCIHTAIPKTSTYMYVASKEAHNYPLSFAPLFAAYFERLAEL